MKEPTKEELDELAITAIRANWKGHDPNIAERHYRDKGPLEQERWQHIALEVLKKREEQLKP